MWKKVHQEDQNQEREGGGDSFWMFKPNIEDVVLLPEVEGKGDL